MRYQDIKLVEDIQLDEINMSPSSLQRLASAIDARAGMEFEMIVPGIGSVDNSNDQEPDYDQDESVRDIDDAVNFFHDGDYNGRNEVRRLRDAMQQDFEEWVIENFDEYWNRNVFELVFEYLTNNASDQDMIEILELEGEEAEDLEQNGSGKREYLAAAEKVIEEADSSSWYDDARDEAQNDYMNDSDREGEWLESAGLNSMMDIENRYQITWPHWHNPNEDSGEPDIDAVADDFSNSIGRPVNASSSYHGARREPGHYVVEPDGSLDPDDSDDSGLEFVSPPLPLSELLDDLTKVKAWADRENCYTNSSTGLHINVSVPNFSLEKLDYVKLALLLGDKYVLEQYGRSANHYAKSALGKVQDLIKRNPDAAKDVLDKMRGHLGDLATKAIHSGSTDKYTSINTKSGYIEFRSPGGDWLNSNFDKIKDTLFRFTVALDAAIDPEKYRSEYLKKLYKLLEPTAVEKNPDTIKYFADYVAGKTPKAALRSFIKQAQLERQLKKGEVGGEKFWWRVANPQYSFGEIEVVASSREEAIEKALGPDGYPNWANTRNTVVAKPIRPYDTKPVQAQVGEPQPVGRSSGPMLGDRPSNPDGNWVISPESDRSVVSYRFRAAGIDDAQIVARQWRQQYPNQVWITQRDDNRTLGQPPIPGSTLDRQRQRAAQQQSIGGTEYIIFKISDRSQLTGFRAANQAAAEQEAESILRDLNLDPDLYDIRERHPAQQPPQSLGAGRELIGWSVRLPSGEEVTQIHGIGNNQGDANRIAAEWLRNNGMGVSGEGFEVVPLWREA